ncbi:P-type conjugative transfer protein TrbG [Sporomusa sphaeroides]|uniref:Conjugal transfer protein n=1 Tax=Sporomusa sphaeroides DSM 2875 TaxID=1337886 RepID=A0A1U7M9X1_9FIRM|nr:P-type conjugative transfer protein TrbG [Sporomusa sphaeroides]OLS54298.1 conjugal transfer protein [Sporomusa sphaeroides DSM 2875]CVK21678.1 Conjugal transfer protein [Sporomusa sphaeroides DSM 2875]
MYWVSYAKKRFILLTLVFFITVLFTPAKVHAEAENDIQPMLMWKSMQVIEDTHTQPVSDTAVQTNNPVKIVNLSQPSELDAIKEQIRQRRQQDDALLASIEAKQKEQEILAKKKADEEALKEKLRQQIIAEMSALQKKQKDEENQKWLTIIEDLKKQNVEQQKQQQEHFLTLIDNFKKQDTEQKQLEILRQQEQQQAFLEAIEDLRPRSKVISLDDPDYAKKTIHQYIADNTQDAKEAISREADVTFLYSPAALYKIYTRIDFLTDIQLQPGEEIQHISGGDTLRWQVSYAQSGSGINKTWHVYIKPNQPGAETNIIILTDKHSYQLHVVATSWHNPIVTWTYPAEQQATFFRAEQRQQQLAANSIPTKVMAPEKLNFDYKISGRKYDWNPTTVFDDGAQTFIKMPASMATSEAPILVVKDSRGKVAIVNYRVRNGYYMVDRLFNQAELRVGRDVVKIKRKAKYVENNNAA